MSKVYNCEIHGIEMGKSSAPKRLAGRLSGFHHLNIEEQLLPDAFDLVICTEVLEHLFNVEKAVDNIARMSSGYLLATVPSGPMRATDSRMGHVRHFSAPDLTRILEKAGFETVSCFRWGFPFHSLYRKMLDVFPAAILQGYAKANYNLRKKLTCQFLYGLFFLNVRSSDGPQLFYLGKKKRDH
jgi:hypothetical protein